MLSTRHIGYEAAEGPVRVTGGETVRVEVRLGRAVLELDPIRVVARSNPVLTPMEMEGFSWRRARGLGRFMDRAEIDERAPVRLSHMLQTLPGVNAGRGTITMRRGCQASIWVDGIEVTRRGASGECLEFDIDDITPAEVDAIEVYKGLASVPAEFVGDDTSCGVVVVWTRRGAREIR